MGLSPVVRIEGGYSEKVKKGGNIKGNLNSIEVPINKFIKWFVPYAQSNLNDCLENVILKNLDMFITVSNSTAHLAGSLVVKTLLIIPKNHALFHYWNQYNENTPWYNSVTLISREDIMNENNLINKNLFQ